MMVARPKESTYATVEPPTLTPEERLAPIEAFFATCPEMLFVANAEGQLESRSAALSRRFGVDDLSAHG